MEKRTGNIGTRYLAYIIDTVIYCTLALVVWFVFCDRESNIITNFPSRRVLMLTFAGFSLVTGTLMETIAGASIGKKICSLELASTDKDRYKPYFTDILSRNLVKNIMFFALALFEHVVIAVLIIYVIYGILPLFTERHRALHDITGHTVVVRESVAFGKDVVIPDAQVRQYGAGTAQGSYADSAWQKVAAPEPEQQAAYRQQGYYIVFTRGVYAGRSIPFGSEITIGKGQDNTLIMPQNAEGVSMRQCRIYYDYQQSAMLLQDTGSEHGTYLPLRNMVVRQGQTVNINLNEPVQIGREAFCLIYES